MFRLNLSSLISACCALAVVAGLLIPAASAEIIDGIVARINRDIITRYDVKRAAIPYLLQKGLEPSALDDDTDRNSIYREVLNDLIDRRLIVEEAEKLDLKVENQELDRWIEYTRSQQNLNETQFTELIRRYGMSQTEYREMVRQNLLRVRMVKIKVGSQATVSADEIERIFTERFGDASEETFYDVSHILFRPVDNTPEEAQAAYERALAVEKRLGAGETFEVLAAEASEGPSRKQSGRLGWFRQGDLDPDFEATAFSLQIGEVSKVVRTQFGFHLIRLSASEQRTSSSAEERRTQIRAELQQRSMERLLVQYVKTLRERAFVEIRD